MPIDWSLFALPKGTPKILDSLEKDRAADRAWEQCIAAVDLRDKRICYVSGRYLTAGAVDAWQDLARNHLDLRSLSPKSKYNPDAVITMSRAAHQLWHAKAFYLKDTAGKDAKRVSAIDHLEWNPRVVPAGDPRPFVVRRGLSVRKA